MIKSDFNHQTGFLDSRFFGKVNLKEIIDYINSTKNNGTLPRILKILTDATSATFEIETNDLNKIVEANNQSVEQYDYIIDAIVLESPKEMALSILYNWLKIKNTFSKYSQPGKLPLPGYQAFSLNKVKLTKNFSFVR
ncbi:MAG: hypothetical protein R2764_21590 [Bacteroidales bacterium]